MKKIVPLCIVALGLLFGSCHLASAQTTTTLALSSTTLAAGYPLTMTASVMSGSTPVYPGLVLFCKASAAHCEDVAILGTAQLMQNGTAALTILPGAGSQQMYAKFVGTNTRAASTSSIQSITINPSTSYGSVTTLASSGNANSYTLTGTVSGGAPSTPTGSVSFIDTSSGSTPIGGSAALTASGFALQPASSYTDNNSNCYDTNCIAVASDFDGDGVADVVYTNYSNATMSISMGNGQGGFGAPTPYATGSNPGFIAVGDFDADGVPDVVVSNNGSNNVGVFLGNGDGTFQSQVTYSTGLAPNGVTVGDFNGDGNADIAVVNANSNSISILLGNGDGTFQPAINNSFTGLHAFSAITVADFNGDGKVDVAATILSGSQSTSGVAIFLGNGNGGFQSHVTYMVGGSVSIAAADFNLDGIPDLAFTLHGGTSALVMLGVGDGTFQSAVSYSVGNPGSIAVGDFNLDGKPDLAVATTGLSGINLLVGNGDGTFQATVSSAGRASGIAVADFNGDGYPDVVGLAGSQIAIALDARSSTYSLGGISFVGTAGIHNIEACYSGVSPYAASCSSGVQLTSSNTTPVLTVTSSQSPVAYGSSVTFTATISSGPTGSIYFYDGSTQIGNGAINGYTATFTTSSLTVGTHTISANWQGNSSYSPTSSGSITQVINPAPPTLTLTTSGSPAAVASAVTFTATISNGVTGSIGFYDRGALLSSQTISNGTASFTTASLAIGVHEITARWAGSGSYASAISPVITQAINGTSIVTALSVSPSSATVGNPVTLTATVKSGSIPVSPGLVLFCNATAVNCEDIAILGTAQLNSTGVASLSIRLGAGTQKIYAIFTGTSAYSPSVSSTKTIVVSPASSYSTITTLQSSGTANGYTLTGTVGGSAASAPTGSVSFYDTSNGNVQIGSSSSLTAGGLALQAAHSYTDNNSNCYDTNCIAVASDFDGDGVVDVVYTNYSAGTMSISMGDGNGGFGTPVSYQTGTYPGFIAVADFNADGVPDVAISNNGSNSAGVFLGNGDGTFQAQVSYPTGSTPQGIGIGDFNGDGNADIATVNANGNSISILLGNGNGTFQSAINSTFSSLHAFSAVTVADFNGDGKLDVAATILSGSQSTSGLAIFLGNGNGSFQSPITYFVGGSVSITSADFNLDGIPDLALTLHGGTSALVMLGVGDGTFQNPTSYTVNSPASIAVGDFNLDGKPDLAVASTGSSGINVLLGNGDGTFQLTTSYAGQAYGIAVADFNGDGYPDVVGLAGNQIGIALDARVSTYTSSGISFTGTAGRHNVEACYGATSTYSLSCSPTVSLTSSNTTPTVVLSSSQNPSPYGGAVTFVATFSNGPAGSVSFYDGSNQIGTALLNGNVATYSSAILSAGNHNITVNWPGNSSYSPVTSTVFLQVVSQTTSTNQATPTISINDLPSVAKYGDGFTVTYSYSGTDSPAEAVTSTTPNICTVSGDTVSYVGVGTCTLVASATATTNYTAVIGSSQSTVVGPATPTIGINNIPTSAIYGGSFTATFSYSGTGSPTESIASSTPNICSVLGATVSYVGIGTCTLTASATAIGNYTATTGNAQSFVVGDSGGSGPGVINTYAGTGTAGYSDDGQAAISAELNQPGGLAIDGAGNIYIADTWNSRIRKIDASTGDISTIAGNGTGGSSGNELFWPRGVAIDSHFGNIYVADTENQLIRKVDASGNISTVAGTGYSGDPGNGVVATSATITYPRSVAVDSVGNVYIVDSYYNKIRELTISTGKISTVVGDGTANYLGDGGPATSAELNSPSGIAFDNAGNLYIADSGNNVIRMVNATTHYISTVAGNYTATSLGDGGAATSAELKRPSAVFVDSVGNIYVADSGNQRIRKVTASTHIISTIAGNGNAGFLGDGGQATSAEINGPSSIVVDSMQNLYISDTGNNRVRIVQGPFFIACAPSAIVYGTTATCTATVAGGSTTGTVSFTYNGTSWASCTLSSGTCSVSGLNTLAPGSYTITGNYSGDSSNPSGVDVTNLTINPVTPTISISNIPYSATYGGSFSVIYSYSATATGSPVESVASNAPSVCTVSGNTVSYVGVGVCTLVASATATADNAAVTGNAQSFTVKAPAITLTSSSNPSSFGGVVTFSATVPGAANGSTIIFYDGGTAIGTGATSGTTATFATKELSIGTHSITAFWPGTTTAIFEVSGVVTQTVNAAAATWDTGTVTLTVSNSGGAVYTASTSYGQSSTSNSVAEALVGSNANVNVTAINDTLYIEATGTGAASDYSYALTSSSSLGLTPPSFAGSPAGGALTGGDSSSSSQQTLYSFCIPGSSNPNCTTGDGYDNVGNLLGYSESTMTTGGLTSDQWSFTYDTLDRLATASTTQAGNSYPNYCWNYDPFGNRLNQISSNQAFPSGSGGAGACALASGAALGQSNWALYNGTVNGVNNNQISATAQNPSQGQYYDASGDMTSDGVNRYLYDAEGRICAETSTPVPGMTMMTGYVYDAEGSRVAKGTITSWSCDPSSNGLMTAGNERDYVLEPGGTPITELAQDANGTMNWQHTYVYDGAELIATYDSVPNPNYNASNPSAAPQTIALPSFRLTDWLGTMRSTTDANGVWQGGCTGLPFGDGLNCQGNIPDPRYFTGKERDQESGNDYFGARYYTSNLGRFMSPDWSAQIEPVPYAKIDDPQSLNLYAYVGNNPLRAADAEGHCWQWSGIPACYANMNGNIAYVGHPPATTAMDPLAAAYEAYDEMTGGGEGQQNSFQVQEAEPEKDDKKEDDSESEEIPVIRQIRRGEDFSEPSNSFKPGTGPLDPKHSMSFKWYVPWKLEIDEVFYRQWGGTAGIQGKDGTYYSLFPPAGSTEFMRQQMGLPPAWGNTMKNTSAVTIPRGTTVYLGPAAPQGGAYSGGGFQVYVPR